MIGRSAKMTHSFDIHVSQKDADLALRRFLLREAGIGMLIATLVSTAYIIYDLLDGDLGRISIVILTVLSIFITVYIIAIFARRKQMKELLAKLGNSPVSYSLDDSELSTKSTLGSTTIKWDMIKKLWIYPDITLIFYSSSGYSTIPTSQVPSDALSFLSDKIKTSGGSILNKS